MPRWNTWAPVQNVLLDYEKTPKLRPVRLSGPIARVGDPVRIGLSGAEIEARITDASTQVLHVKVKATDAEGQGGEKRNRTGAPDSGVPGMGELGVQAGRPDRPGCER